MQYQQLVASVVKHFEKLISFYLLFHEDQYTSFFVPLAKQLHEPVELVILLYDFDVLLDVAVGGASVADHYFDGGD